MQRAFARGHTSASVDPDSDAQRVGGLRVAARLGVVDDVNHVVSAAGDRLQGGGRAMNLVSGGWRWHERCLFRGTVRPQAIVLETSGVLVAPSGAIFPDVVPALAALRRAGIITVALDDIAVPVDVTFAADHDAFAVRLAIESLGFEPARWLVVGARVSSMLVTAHRLGTQTAILDRQRGTPPAFAGLDHLLRALRIDAGAPVARRAP